ncbi:hypothetical protein L841_2314 [Mycobacterium sp. MAC_080597_8934]|nr:hypothetical protein L841_2314 [Mycobacterium sp. MAC_080597_8934]
MRRAHGLNSRAAQLTVLGSSTAVLPRPRGRAPGDGGGRQRGCS